jgi:hypothetical protein
MQSAATTHMTKTKHRFQKRHHAFFVHLPQTRDPLAAAAADADGMVVPAAADAAAPAAAAPRSPRHTHRCGCARGAFASRSETLVWREPAAKLTFESTRLKKIIAATTFQVHHPARFRQTFLPTHHNSTVA